MTGMMTGTGLMTGTETGQDSDNPLHTINRSALAERFFSARNSFKNLISTHLNKVLMIRRAKQNDIPYLVALINSAYRGEASKKGWTTEANLVSGDIRTDTKQLEELMNNPGTAFIVWENEKGLLEGSVYLHKKENTLYLGMLSVLPELQAKGIGKKLMSAAEAYAILENCNSIYMRVISARHELISWYEKLGYKNSGKTEPFENNKYGTATMPLEFIIMEKMI